MPEETGAGAEKDDHINRRLERLEQKLEWEERWWRGGLIAALVFIAIAILIAGHRHRRRPQFPPWMAYGAGQFAPPSRWGWGYPQGGGPYGWGQGPWGGGPGPWGGGRPPSSEPPNR